MVVFVHQPLFLDPLRYWNGSFLLLKDEVYKPTEYLLKLRKHQRQHWLISLEHYQVWLKYSHNKCEKLQLWRNQGIRVVRFETLIWFVTWLVRFTKTYPILHNLSKRIPYFEGLFSNSLVFDPSSCTKPIGWNPVLVFWKVKHFVSKGKMIYILKTFSICTKKFSVVLHFVQVMSIM